MAEARAVTAYFLGGTISMTGHRHGAVSRLTGDELVAAVPQLSGLDVDLEVRDFRRLPSACLTFADVVALVEDAAATTAEGVVVVQGTDTIEETAYLIDLLWPHDIPLVVTGAMRNPTLAGPDGPANLLAAVAVAASPAARGQGVLVVLNDRIHAARFVRKTHSIDVATFASPDTGPLGMLVEGEPVLMTRVPRAPVFAPIGPVQARVPVRAVTLDQDPGSVAALAAGCDGLVVAGFGVGHVPDWLAEPLGDLATRVPVVLASRTGGGPVLTRTYGFTGSESDLRSRGLIGAGLLDPAKARVLLRVALACGYDRPATARAFAQATGGGPGT
jgi:L-asparaginase/Glu-tRNA(Gln) amidotransferase subunit D